MTSAAPELRLVSHQEFTRYARNIGRQIQAKGLTITKIVAINTGGANLAVELSDALGKVPIISAGAKSYTSIHSNQEVTIHQKLTQDDFQSDDLILVVDDICDTGQTLHEIVGMVKDLTEAQVLTATMFVRQASRDQVDFAAEVDERWIVFPHEISETTHALKDKWQADPELKKTLKNYFIDLGEEPGEVEKLLS